MGCLNGGMSEKSRAVKTHLITHDPNNIWKGQSLYQLYKKAFTPWEWHKPIIKRCSELGIACFSTPFDSSAIDFLEDLDVPAYKISSFENTDLPLIRKAVGKDFPLIFDSGIRSGGDILKALALGANFVMLGRPLMYAVGADGAPGLRKILDIIKEELSTSLGLVGLNDIKQVSNSILSEDLFHTQRTTVDY